MTARMVPQLVVLALSLALALAGAAFFAACLFGGWVAGTWVRTIANVAGAP